LGRQEVTTVIELKWSLRNSDIVCERWLNGGDKVRIMAMEFERVDIELDWMRLDWTGWREKDMKERRGSQSPKIRYLGR
jgi:hypothetical protein